MKPDDFPQEKIVYGYPVVVLVTISISGLIAIYNLAESYGLFEQIKKIIPKKKKGGRSE